MQHPTLSRACAVVAGVGLLLTLGGVGGAVAAALVTSADIKNETIRALDIAPGAVTRSEVRNGTVGVGDLSTYVQRELAQQAQDGTDGLDGTDGVAALESENTSEVWTIGPAGGFHSAWVACPTGKAALGGGYRPDPQDGPGVKGLQVVSSAPAQIDPTLEDDPATPADEAVVPIEPGVSPNGWLVTGFNNSNTDLTVQPWVICAAVN
jgi:hypothetical protein